MRFLIVKASSLGDILHSFYALNYLREKFPDAKIDWVVEKRFAKILQTHPHLNKVIVLPKKKKKWLIFLWQLRKKKYAAVFDLQGNCKSAFILLFTKAQNKVGFGKKTVKEWPNLGITNFKVNPDPSKNIRFQYLQILQEYFQDRFVPKSFPYVPFLSHEEKCLLRSISFPQKIKKVMVCFGSNWPNKQPQINIYPQLMRKLLEKDKVIFYLVWGNEEEKQQAETLRQILPHDTIVLPLMSLSLWKTVLGKMDAMIGVDSGALHIADACFVPTFSFFGPTMAHIFKPIGKNHFYFQGDCPYKESFTKQCPKLRTCPTGNCLKKISINLLTQKLMRWWEGLYK